MASACVVLDRTVAFRDHPLEEEPPGLGEEASGPVVGGNIAAPSRSRPYLSLEDKEATTGEYLRATKPDLQVVDAPGVSYLTMVRPHSRDPIPQFGRNLKLGFVAAAHKSLVVIYAGTTSYSTWYLVLDLASSSPRSFTIPCAVYSGPGSYRSAGSRSTVVTPLHPGGAIILADLLFCIRLPGSDVLSSAMLCLWNSRRGSWWEYKPADLPAQVCYAWSVHLSFPAVQSTKKLLCWVDLLHGLLLCDLDEAVHSVLHMSFVPLPPNSCEPYDQRRRLLNPQDFRTMACVDGTIKFFAMDGFVEGTPISLVTYALDFDGPSASWTKDTVLRLEDLWADETYISMDLPGVTPLFPILSTQEHDVVYLFIPSDVELIDGYRARRVQFLLSVDTRKAKIISATQQNLPRTLFTSRYLVTFDADSQLGSSKYHQHLHTTTTNTQLVL